MNIYFNYPSRPRHPTYAAFLVRLWQDSPDGPWRASA